MKFNQKLKCISITKKEVEDIEKIYNSSTCLADAADKVKGYLANKEIINIADKGTINLKYISKWALDDLAFHLVEAVINRYKYMKIED